MGQSLDQLTLEGFKSIRELRDFKLEKLNVLIGPNGAGKSNFVDFFRLLRAMADGNLAAFVAKHGKAANFFFDGPKATPQIHAKLKFGPYLYDFSLEPTQTNEVLIEERLPKKSGGSWLLGPKPEPSLKDWKPKAADAPSYQGEIYRALSGQTVYHFQDTGMFAPMRRETSSRDFRELAPDAGNIAAFLWKLQKAEPPCYQRIRETIQIIAPFFDDFLLEPEGDQQLVRLEWRQKGSRFPFQPWNFSDGTIRFICLTTALLQPNPPSTIIIDEPELGLHPRALEVFASLVQEVSQTTQIIVSTQSATLVDHFQPNDIIVVQREGNASTFRRLDSTEFDTWLEEYSLSDLVRKNVIEAGPVHG
ncbi:MAG: AAA family ATPase [Verrucomicrobia bacterium]|nr:AAA family ATPase [Verrucomicrobiota bacterium]